MKSWLWKRKTFLMWENPKSINSWSIFMLAMKVQMTALRIVANEFILLWLCIFLPIFVHPLVWILESKFWRRNLLLVIKLTDMLYVVCLCVCFLFKSSFSYIMQNIKFDWKVIYLLATYLLDNFYSHGLYAVLL